MKIFRTLETHSYFIINPPFNSEHKPISFKYDSSVPLIDKVQLTNYLTQIAFYKSNIVHFTFRK